MRYLSVLIVFLLAGCANTDMSDLHGFVADVKARPAGGIKPIPEFVEAETFLYLAADRRDPFVAQVEAEEVTQAIVENGIQPDFARRKEELEGYSLDSLRMVGTLEQDDQSWGLVQTREGTIHRVSVGNYMGQNHGKIIQVAEDKIELIELVQSGSGYIEKEAALGLGEE